MSDKEYSGYRGYIIIAVSCAIWLVISICEEKHARSEGGPGEKAFRFALEQKPLALRWAVLLLGFAMVLVLGSYGPGYDASAFIYRGF